MRVSTRRASAALRRLALPCLLFAPPAVPTLEAQTDYYNTDAGRPLRVEDAHAIERRAVEIQFAPLRLERGAAGRYQWGVEPELAVGLLPRTQVEVGVPLAFLDGPAGTRTTGLAGVDLSVLHQLNAETALPSLALAGAVLVPAGPLGPSRAYGSLKAIATRTLPQLRIHVNAQRTFGPSPAPADGGDPIGAGAAELSRWMAGVSVDRPMPLRAMLVSVELFAEQPMDEGEPVEWATAAGMRVQATPRIAVDAGLGAHLSRPTPRWFATVGAAVAVGLPWRNR